MGHKYEPTPRKGDYYKKAWGYELWIVNNEDYCGKLLVFEKDKKHEMVLNDQVKRIRRNEEKTLQ